MSKYIKKTAPTTSADRERSQTLDELYRQLDTSNIDQIMPKIRALEIKIQLSHRRRQNAHDLPQHSTTSHNRNTFTRFEY